MVRCPNPVQYRPHHTRPGASGMISGVISLALLGLLGGCVENEAESGVTTSTPTQSTASPSPSEPLGEESSGPIATLHDPTNELVAANRLMQAKARRLVVPADPVAVDLYTLDDRCEGYQTEPIQVPRQQSMENTVALIMAEQVTPELTLSGYRTSFDPETNTVTIDLRVARDSRRVLQSLSVCEQKALLGSLRETLINQPDWKIEAVTFTNRGNPLVL
ncbi:MULTISPECIES: hypothetical protein [Cyanophyceae]|uniref:Sporulation/spore germination protein n=1 Tax=Leptolyngbya subtilissima DQ-A4 TaxID=2933933 RepID=A0ABV0JZB1_9CYAN|nr:hypothetical protein [Nodosilinea sp. FACHB-141]MBD2112166.1 hypothetical protein [Nodosilinea sp. FACHB-141]